MIRYHIYEKVLLTLMILAFLVELRALIYRRKVLLTHDTRILSKAQSSYLIREKKVTVEFSFMATTRSGNKRERESHESS